MSSATTFFPTLKLQLMALFAEGRGWRGGSETCASSGRQR